MQPRRVGKPYSEGKTASTERAEYAYSRHGHELRLFLHRPLRAEFEAVSLSLVELALVTENDVLLLLCRFLPGIPWTAAPYTWWLIPADEQPRVLPPITPDKRAILQVHLIDAATGILAAVRTATLSPKFTSTLEALLRTHFEARLNPADYRERLQALQQQYSDLEALVPQAYARYRTGE